MSRRLCLLLLLCLLPLVAFAQAVTPRATLDRADVHLGETVTLNITIDGAVDVTPDLGPLTPDFVILGTSNNSSLSIVNGQRSVRTTVGVALRPLRMGNLTIPPISVGGGQTQALQLNVSQADNSTTAAKGPVFLEAVADPATAYVGEQVDFSLRLFYVPSLTDGSIGDPQAEGVEIRRLGNDANFTAERDGRRYNVVERHYAVFPQRAGEITFKPTTFRGEAADPNDPNAFFGSTTPVGAVSNTVTLTVKDRPAAAGDGAWLPARALSLTLDGWPADGKARVGEPLTLTMRLRATGLPFETLPAPSLPKIDGADVYPDKAVTGTGDDDHWLQGRREQSFAVVPSRPGSLHIPETTVRWWNVQTDRLETASIPAHTLEVAGAAAAAAGKVPTVVTPAADAAGVSSLAHRRWSDLGLISLALWAVTVVAAAVYWFVRRRPRTPRAIAATPLTSARGLHQAFLAAVASGDLAAQEATLLAWARSERPTLRSLGEVSAALSAAAQRAAIEALERARFGGSAAPAGDVLRQAFEKGFAWSSATSSDQATLPPLYPR
jgi:hypothetical protein